MHAYTDIHIQTQTYTHAGMQNIQTYSHADIYIYRQTYAYTLTYAHTRMYTNTHNMRETELKIDQETNSQRTQDTPTRHGQREPKTNY